jgi:UDP-N-acetylmuramate dehydrogenase
MTMVSPQRPRTVTAAGTQLPSSIESEDNSSTIEDVPVDVRRRQNLRTMNWFGTNGVAEYFAQPGTYETLARLVEWAQTRGHSVRILGEGANCLIPDGDIAGIVIRLGGPVFDAIERSGPLLIAGAGAKLSHVMRVAIRAGLGGIERLAGIPATIGGACVGNAGGRSGDFGQWVDWVEIVGTDGQPIRMNASEIDFGYRKTSLESAIVVRVALRLRDADPQLLRLRYVQALREKKKTQPLQNQSGGCVFKNIRGISARLLIEDAGLAGRRVGGAHVSALHCNFFIADPGTTAADILNLMTIVQAEVRAKTGMRLEPEINIW